MRDVSSSSPLSLSLSSAAATKVGIALESDDGITTELSAKDPSCYKFISRDRHARARESAAVRELDFAIGGNRMREPEKSPNPMSDFPPSYRILGRFADVYRGPSRSRDFCHRKSEHGVRLKYRETLATFTPSATRCPGRATKYYYIGSRVVFLH